MLRVRASLVARALQSRRLSALPMHTLSSYLRRATSSMSRAFASTAAQSVQAQNSPLNIPAARGPDRVPLNLKVGDTVHGFQCISINAYNDMGVQAYKFVHPVFGCEWLHLDTDDTCNTFSVSFRTVPTDSTGVAHVLEHSVLCGSNRFPVRDPFFNMLRRSLQTFMNAMTGADYTVYPFATQNAQDFVNLLSVYVDAAFFPRLRVEDFWQEGHRVEWAKSDAPTDAPAAQLAFKGIVFNEMKGAMSDSNSRFSYALREALFPPNHTYHHNSGGDPQSIVNLTHTQLVDFHRQHYHPSNARFFTFGDISPHTSMRHVAEHVLAHFPAPPASSLQSSARTHPVTDSTDFGAAAALDSTRGWSVESHPRSSTRVPLAERHLLPATRHFECPPDPMTNEDDDKQHRIALAWLCEESYPDQSNAPNVVNEKLVRISATHLLSQLLFECSPAAPLYAALIESGLGSAFIQDSGFDPSGRESVFCVGVQGAKSTDFQQIEQVIMDTLRRVCDTGAGLTRERIDSFLHQYELSLAHVPGQRGLALLFRVMSPWTHDADPTRALDIDQTLQLLRKRLEGDAGIAYLRSLISDFALNNKHRVLVTMSPSESFLDAQMQAEKALLERRLNAMSEESRQAVQTRADQLSQSQQSVQDIDVLPTLRRSDIATSTPAYAVNDVNVASVAVQVCPQPTNGIAYFKASLDIEKLLPAAGLSWTQWDLLPVLSQLTTSMATETRSAEQLALDMNRFTGGIHATPSILPGAFQPTSGLSSIAKFQAALSLASPLNWPSPKAYWTVSSHALQRNADQMMKLSAELFAQPRFHDVKRLKAMIASTHASMTTALQESGHLIARSYAAAALGAQHTILNDRWSGLHQLRLIDSIHNRLQRDDAAVSEFADSLASLSQALHRHSAAMSSHQKPAWRGALNAVSTQTEQLLSSFQTSFLKSVTASDVNNAATTSSLIDESPLSYADKAFVALPIQVHHVAMVLPTVSFYHPDAPALSLLASMLTDRFLHREIREKGGAYGGGASHSATDGYFSFSSYRDPNCAQTLDAFRASIEWICNETKPAISQRELDEALLSVFSDFDRPIAPASVGAARFARGVDHEAREEFRKRLLAVRINDVINVARRYLKDRLQSDARVCVVGPSDSVQALQSAGEKWKVIEM